MYYYKPAQYSAWTSALWRLTIILINSSYLSYHIFCHALYVAHFTSSLVIEVIDCAQLGHFNKPTHHQTTGLKPELIKMSTTYIRFSPVRGYETKWLKTYCRHLSPKIQIYRVFIEKDWLLSYGSDGTKSKGNGRAGPCRSDPVALYSVDPVIRRTRERRWFCSPSRTVPTDPHPSQFTL